MGDEKDKNGVYGKFRLQNLRKLFKTTCRRGLQQIKVNSDKTFDGDVISLFTGHITPNNPLAEVYEAVEDDSHDSYIRKIYQGLIPYLSIYPTETKAFKEQEYLEMEEKIETLEEQSKLKDVEHQRDMDEKDKKIAELEQKLVETQDTVKLIQKKTDKSHIRETIKQHFRKNQRVKILQRSNTPDDTMKCFVIEDLAYQYAIKEGFEDSEETINKYINKAIIQSNLHPELVDEMIENGTSYDREMTENRHINVLFDNFCEYLKTQGDIWEMIDDESKLKNIFFKYMHTANYDISEISDDDMNKISENVLMEYIQ